MQGRCTAVPAFPIEPEIKFPGTHAAWGCHRVESETLVTRLEWIRPRSSYPHPTGFDYTSPPPVSTVKAREMAGAQDNGGSLPCASCDPPAGSLSTASLGITGSGMTFASFNRPGVSGCLGPEGSQCRGHKLSRVGNEGCKVSQALLWAGIQPQVLRRSEF